MFNKSILWNEVHGGCHMEILQTIREIDEAGAVVLNFISHKLCLNVECLYNEWI